MDGREAITPLPVGTVTFLRTDVEGSMALARTLGPRWDAINAAHLGLIRRAVDEHGGVCIRTEGDALFGVFPEAGAAVAAAVQAQRALAGHDWPDDAPVRIRMGLHSGEAHLAGDDYGGFEVNRAARIAATGHGGQIVLSDATRVLVEPALADGLGLRDLGRHALRDVPVPERLFQLDVPGLRTDFPPLRTASADRGNLPLRLTSFVGRDRELDELATLFEQVRLITLTGPGGIGKTSLAVELARAQAPNIDDDVWFVALDEVADASSVTAVIARNIGLYDGPERSGADALLPYLSGRSALLVLDNFEHLLDASSDVAAILRASPGTRLVVTSRAPLHIAGEQEYPVAPLAVRGAASAGLFVERARAVRPGWDPAEDREVIDEICGLLDGLPLGIELAAARVSLLPVQAIRDRLAARLPLPGSGRRDVPGRQRTLDGAIAWSHDLLGPGERRLLHDLAVFDGGFDVEQASRVAGRDVIDGLDTLVDHSLVARDVAAGPTGVRFRMLQTIRRFALDQLSSEGREAEIRRGHAEAYLALAEQAARNLPGPDQPRWLDRLALDHANLRAALRWTIDAGEVELALRFVTSLWRYWQFDGHLAEGHDLADAAMAMPGADAPTAARLGAITAAGGIAYWRGKPDEALRLYEEQLELATRLGDLPAQADAVFNRSYGRFVDNDFAGAERMINDATQRYIALGDERGAARAEWTRATLAMNLGNAAEAMPIFESALERFERLGDAWYHAMTIGSIAWARFALDETPAANRAFIQSLIEYHAIRDSATTTISLQVGALVALDAGQPEDAAALLGAFDQLCEIYGVTPPLGLKRLIASAAPLERAAAALGPERLASAMERGRGMSLDEAVELVVGLGDDIERAPAD